MSTPVVTDTWAGSFDCDFCRRKRLMGEEFSKKALERYRKHGGPLKCKRCVQEAEQAERDASAAKQKANKSDVSVDEQRVCASCKQQRDYAAFNKNQWNKGEGKSRCRGCVEEALEKEKATQQQTEDAKLQAAQEKVDQAKRNGTPQEVLKAESELSALEAEKVTGLKPVRMGRGRGGRGSGRRSAGGRSRGRGRGNGRS